MNRLTLLMAAVLTLTVGLCSNAFAQGDICGPAPALTNTAESAESVQGELRGEADLLLKWVGNAELGGKIEAARKTIYQSSDAYFAAQKDAYLAYIFCVIVMRDTQLDTNAKLDAIQKFKSPAPGTQGDGSGSSPAKTYSWREDAERLGYIYSGMAFCEKNNSMTSECMNKNMGNFTRIDGSESYANTLTVTEKTMSVTNMEFRNGVLHREMREEANISDLKEVTSYWTGNYSDGTPSISIQLECLVGNCVRWTGWQWESHAPGQSSKHEYRSDAVMAYITIAIANNYDDDLIVEMRRIFARLISEDHTDTGEIACMLLCAGASCPWITDDCAKEMYENRIQ